MSTPPNSDRLASGDSTSAGAETPEVEHAGRPHRGGSVLARIPDVRPHLEEEPKKPGKRHIRVDAGNPETGTTTALLRQDHSSWHVSRRLVALIGLVVAGVGIAAYIQWRDDSASPEERADLSEPSNTSGPGIDGQANRITLAPTNVFGQRDDWRSGDHDHSSHDRNDQSQRVPDYFSRRDSSFGDTQPLGDTQWSERPETSKTDIPWKAPGQGVDPTHQKPADAVTHDAVTHSEIDSHRNDLSNPIDGRPRVVASLSSDARYNATRGRPVQRQSIFPWRRSGQRLSWQRSSLQRPSWQRPSLQRPEERTSAWTDPQASRFEGRYDEGTSGGGQFVPRNDNTLGQQRPYPVTGYGEPYVPTRQNDPSRYDDPRDYRSARGGTTLGDAARRSTYDDRRRRGTSLDGHIEPYSYDRVRR